MPPECPVRTQARWPFDMKRWYLQFPDPKCRLLFAGPEVVPGSRQLTVREGGARPMQLRVCEQQGSNVARPDGSKPRLSASVSPARASSTRAFLRNTFTAAS